MSCTLEPSLFRPKENANYTYGVWQDGKQTGKTLHTAEHQWWRRSFHLFYDKAQACLSFFQIGHLNGCSWGQTVTDDQIPKNLANNR